MNRIIKMLRDRRDGKLDFPITPEECELNDDMWDYISSDYGLGKDQMHRALMAASREKASE